MKKVAIIVSSLTIGGAETMVVRLAKNINKSRYAVQVICLSGKNGTGLEKELEDANISTHYLGKNKGASIKAFKKLWKTLSKFKPDVVHGNISGTIYALPWVCAHKCKLIHTIHTKPDNEFNKIVRFILKVFVNLKKVVFVAVSKENQTFAIDYYGIKESKCAYVNNPVELDKYYRKPHGTGEVRFINVSRQDSNKNQALAIRVFEKIYHKAKNVRLTLVGDGSEHNNLINLTNEAGLADVISFPGMVSNAEDYLAGSDVYISTSHMEALPLSILEAVATGLPIISSNVGGCSALVKNNGYLFKDNDEETLYELMYKLVQSEDLRNQLSSNSYDIVKKYDAVACANKYMDIYDSLL